jgi:hypothetical protein
VLSSVGIIMVVAATLPPLLNVLGRPDLALWDAVACAVVMPAGFLLGAVTDGLEGVCLAWLIGYPLIVATVFHFTRHVTGVGVGRLLRAQLPLILAVLVMSAAVAAVQQAVSTWPGAIFRLALAIVTGAAVYPVVVLLFARRTVVNDLVSLWRELRGSRA